MKTFWILEPSPFKSKTTINAIIYANIVRAQSTVKRELTRQQIHTLLRAMKDKNLFMSKQDSWDLYNSFISAMKQHRLIVEKRPDQG